MVGTQCWFTNTNFLPPHKCYYMTVSETPNRLDGRTVSFPVVVFDSLNAGEALSPLLHLGGGGPGASLALDSEYNVLSLYEQMRPLSVYQGRDLVLIDPRGAGQSRPLMMCQEFVDNVIPRWKRNMTIRESYDDGHENFDRCLENLRNKNINFSAYSSTTVVQDLEELRKAINVERWILYGASYASVYAQLYAREFPARIESMVLDSATFLDTPRHEVLVREMTEPYQRLFSYCGPSAQCTQRKEATQRRFWKLVNQLDEDPVRMSVTHPEGDTEITVALTGWRFLDSMLWGVYEEEIFNDFPVILDELEHGETRATRRYVEELLIYLMDESFGDISASSHFCVDRKPYIDEAKVREQIELIPYEYARNIAKLGFKYVDYCKEMSITQDRGDLDQPIRTGVATLFIHGELDSVTLLDHVTERQKNFRNSHIVTSRQAHIVLDDPCILETAAKFIATGVSDELESRCSTE